MDARKGRLADTVEERLGLLRKLAEALIVAHRGIVHRDLKPENILIEERGDKDVVRILDFGIAVLLEGEGQMRSRKMTGSPFYMAPEQAAGESVDGRADLYSVGVMFYQMVTGDLPIEDDNFDQFFVKLLNDYPEKISEAYPDIEIPKATEDAILNCLAKDPFNRFENAGAMLATVSGSEKKKISIYF